MSTTTTQSRPSAGREPGPIWERGTEDERVDFLSKGIAYEARVLKAHTDYHSRIPKSLAGMVEGSAHRMAQAALGEGEKTYLYGIDAGRASAAMSDVMEAQPAAAPLIHFSDRENSMRIGFAYEAAEIERMLAFAGFPKSRRRFAEEQIARMRMVAAGGYERAFASTNSRSFESAIGEIRREAEAS